MATFTVWGPIRRSDLPGLCERVCALLARSGPGDVLCDVDGVEPNAVTVDALARLQLAAQRRGCRIRLERASAELSELVELLGLTDVLVPRRGRREPEPPPPGALSAAEEGS